MTDNATLWGSVALANHLSKLDAALLYASLGIKVFPLAPKTKRPLLKGSWKDHATTDRAQIKEWWTNLPEANIAGAMGFDSGQIIAADLDMKKGQDGWQSYQHIAPGPVTSPLQQTPSGGYHVIHEWVPDLINFTHKGEFGGVDMRTDNGYIVMAPSWTEKSNDSEEGYYQWIQGGVPQISNAHADQYTRWSQESKVRTNLDMPEPADIDNLKPLIDTALPQRHLQFLQTGEVDNRFDGDRSSAMLGAAGALYRMGFNDSEVLAYLESSYAMDVAVEHRPRGDALEWIWEYTCLKARESLPPPPPPTPAEAFSGIPTPGQPESPEGEAAVNPQRLIPAESENERLERLADNIRPGDDDDIINIYMAALKVNAIFGARIADILCQRGALTKSALAQAAKEAKRNLRTQNAQGAELGYPDFPFVNESGAPRDHVDNVVAICNTHGIHIQHNLMKHSIEVFTPGGVWDNEDRINQQLSTMRDFAVQYGMPHQRMGEHLNTIARRNSYHPMVRLLDSVQWDGVPRLQRMLDTIKTPHQEERNTYVTKWMLSGIAVLRGYGNIPPRGVFIFTGAQAKGKTSWLKYLTPDGLFGEGKHLDLNNKDSIKEAISYYIVELGELDGTFNRSELAHLKAYLSRENDTIRLPYAPSESTFTRRTIYAGTVNHIEFLKDQTGNSRFWPIEVDDIDLDTIRIMKEQGEMLQVWKEVEAMYYRGDQWWLTRDELTKLEQHNENFREVSGIEQMLLDKFNWDNPDRCDMTLTEVAKMLDLKLNSGRDHPDLRNALVRLTGNRRAVPKKVGGKTQRVWKVPVLL
jgi:hypothetical protein